MGMVVFVAAVVIYTALAAVTDARMHRIPNVLTVPTALLGLAYHTLAPTGWGPLVALAGFGVGFALLLLPWLLGGGGMGDVKLLAALGAWLGPWWVLIAFAVSGGVAALLAMAIMVRNATTRGVMKTSRKYLGGKTHEPAAKRRPRVLPFAVPVAVSTWAVLAWMVTRGGF
ncbi:MAG: A24 family peptidase [Thermoguttaceae bacterium]|jgi:prepilin peptidase CpaA